MVMVGMRGKGRCSIELMISMSVVTEADMEAKDAVQYGTVQHSTAQHSTPHRTAQAGNQKWKSRQQCFSESQYWSVGPPSPQVPGGETHRIAARARCKTAVTSKKPWRGFIVQ